MCLAVPLKVVSIEGNTAQAEIEGVKRTIRIDFIKDVNVGDYVIVHAGFAIEKLKEEDAIENLRLIKEVTDALK
ncbi:HypC/HybG/HupF family hydrogenase formation chaperone [Caloramator sp. mosi_1]|uniref:HypC/HybG/HupF family hydrogenase formation chaperone n=1 Tax=Caloramator sp. mosi_1 TaxID=3023090 RepID=UPI00236033A2|nr:HypC/HybG/HupF family hydrogenase formation chaperone [Caloramator sp. mosi_1]WDC83826.1 HypC/HybG/HupF family hydrogenase formation chaperone [Caloramator sp. mosi_1]